MWLPKDDLQDSSSWSSPPLLLLRDIHSNLLTQYDCKEVCVSSQSQVNVGSGPRPSSQDGVSHLQEPVPLSLPQLNRLVEASFVWDESSASNAHVAVIPSQHRVTQQILSHWEPFRDLKSRLVGSCRAEQLNLHSQQCIVSTVEDSVLRTEMTDLESLEEDEPKRIFFYKPMG